MEAIMDYSKTLSNYQKNYPNLAEFTYDANSDCLVYEGNFIKLNGYGLSRIDPVFFNLNPEDIFTYLKNAFYRNDEYSMQIINLTNQIVITEEEQQFIYNFVNLYFLRLNIYASNRNVFDKYFDNDSIKAFMKEIKQSKNIIDKAKEIGSQNEYSVYGMILSQYNNELNSMNQSQGLDNGVSLTRAKPGFSGYSEFQNNENYLKQLQESQKMNMAGYTSIILIVASALTFGMYLAFQLLK